jgi:hypothetical protein
MSCSPFHKSTKSTAFQVIDARHIVFVFKAQRITHQDQVHLLIVLHLHRVRVLFQILVQLWKNLLDKLQFFSTHSFNNKTPIVTEEEETATCTGGLSCLEDLFAVIDRVKGFENLFEVDIVHYAHSLENTC